MRHTPIVLTFYLGSKLAKPWLEIFKKYLRILCQGFRSFFFTKIDPHIFWNYLIWNMGSWVLNHFLDNFVDWDICKTKLSFERVFPQFYYSDEQYAIENCFFKWFLNLDTKCPGNSKIYDKFQLIGCVLTELISEYFCNIDKQNTC